MNIKTAKQLNTEIKSGNLDNLFMLGEAYYDRQLVTIVNSIIESKKRIILLAGPSASGKTTTAKKICLHLQAAGLSPLYLGTDDYFINRADVPFDKNGKQNFEGVDALDLELFNNNLRGLLDGKKVDLPRYDFPDGTKHFGERVVKARKDNIFMIEGIHGLNDELTPLIDAKDKYKIFVSPLSAPSAEGSKVKPADIREIRRLIRDYYHRGWSVEETFAHWPDVIRGEKKNILPFRKYADAEFDSALFYELAVLKKYALPLLKKVSKRKKEYAEAQRLLAILEPYDIIEDDSGIERDSILREFIGGGAIE